MLTTPARVLKKTWKNTAIATITHFEVSPRPKNIITSRAGLSVSHITSPEELYIMESTSGGVGFIDCDNDGKLDIYSTNIRSEDAWYAQPPTVNRYMLNSWRQGVWKTDMPLYWEVFKQSGFGRELGIHGIDEYLETKQVHINLNEAPIGWY